MKKKTATSKSVPFALPKGALTFFAGLEKNNNKPWFEQHRDDYHEHVLEPLKTLVLGLGAALSKKLPGLRYEPRVNGSIFRIYRNARFSKDKRPYKTHAGAFLWVGPAGRLACPGVYFHLEAKTVMLGSGVYMFERDYLDAYRKYVAAKGAVLARAIAKAEKAGFAMGGEALKRAPAPYPRDHKHADLLRMKGLHVGKTYPASKVTKGDLIGWLAKEYTPTLDLVKVLEKAIF